MCGKTPKGIGLTASYCEELFDVLVSWHVFLLGKRQLLAVSITTLKTKHFVQQVVHMIILSFSSRFIVFLMWKELRSIQTLKVNFFTVNFILSYILFWLFTSGL